ncbi:MAG: tRNA uridine-5-carboxymethylaminomethyl(34) synthesis GTPase MnmE [Eubacteriales bacterium]|nr:tRNA uridine-5-carboxymethylaminomethyl(34) synthesis GTPase MnmE [Eubacteriales bacterium]
MTNDTIAAIATGLTTSGIGIVRISGPESYEIINRIFVNKNGGSVILNKPNRIHYGFINVSRETLDEVLVMNMRAPHSFTGEDTIEIDCHGGPLMMKRMLEAVIDAGARLAEPGEFTKRAFLNGRIDLAQAEAVIDVINSTNDSSIKASVAQLKGSVSNKVRELREELIHATAFIEAALDDPEHYELDNYGDEIMPKLTSLHKSIEELVKTYKYGRFVREGINTCILGKPNAGKSSLLNAILGEERAIVTDVAGTTRDAIKETVTYKNITLNIVDTAGVRETEDKVERIGVEIAYKEAIGADLVLYVIDSTIPMDESDKRIIEFLEANGLKTLYLLNKTDLLRSKNEDVVDLCGENVSRETLKISTVTGEGISELLEKIHDMYTDGSITENNQVVITSERHVESLRKADKSICNVIESIEAGLPEDFFTIDLMDAYKELGLIIGEETEEDLVNRIFSEFCMGK